MIKDERLMARQTPHNSTLITDNNLKAFLVKYLLSREKLAIFKGELGKKLIN